MPVDDQPQRPRLTIGRIAGQLILVLGILVLFICLAPALGSWYAMVPGLVIDILLVAGPPKKIRCCKQNWQVIKNMHSAYAFD